MLLKDRAGLVASVCLVVGLIVAYLAQAPRDPSETRSVYVLGSGHEAPGFKLPILSAGFQDGTPDSLALSDLRGKYVVLTFWATWCGPCRAKYPELVALKDRYGHQGVEVVGILHGDAPRRALEFMEERNGATYTTLVDQGDRVARRYRVAGIPHTILIGPDGLIKDIELGWRGGMARDLDAQLGELVGPRDI